MTEPTYTAATEDTYGLLARFRRIADRQQGYPLKRFFSGVLDQLGVITRTYERIDYLSPGEIGSDNRPLELYTNLIGNPSYEDPGPLPAVTLNAAASRSSAQAASVIDGGSYSLAFVATANGTFGGRLNPAPALVVDGSGLLTVAADVYAFPGRTIRFRATCYNAAAAVIGTVDQDVTYDVPGFATLSATLALPAGTVTADLDGYVLAGVAGEQAYIDTVIAVNGSTVRPYTRYSGVAAGDTSDLVNPDTADDAWLDWLGQLVGVRIPPGLTHAERVDAVRYASAGWRGGTKKAVADAAKTALTGSKYAKVYDHSTEAGIGAGGQWDVLVLTRYTETPDVAAVLDAVVRKNAKPAGVLLHHLAYSASWAAIEAAYPTWGSLAAAGSWAVIEEAGL